MGAAKKIYEVVQGLFELSSLDRVIGQAPRLIRAEALFGEAFRSPLIESEEQIQIRSAAEHAFFMRLCELYRVLELLSRTRPKLIEIYSRFRERKQFEDTLDLRYFETQDSLAVEFDPNLSAINLAIYNHLLELRIYLRFTDDLPSTVDTHILEALLSLIENWNALVDGVFDRYAWNFKKL